MPRQIIPTKDVTKPAITGSARPCLKFIASNQPPSGEPPVNPLREKAAFSPDSTGWVS